MEEGIELFVCLTAKKKLHISTSYGATEVDLGFQPWVLAFINDSSFAIGGGRVKLGSLEIRLKDNNELIHEIDLPNVVYSLAVSPDGHYLCVGMLGSLFVCYPLFM